MVVEMTYSEIIEAIKAGKKVHWKNVGYYVFMDFIINEPRVLLSYMDQNYIGLSEEAFKQYKEEDFFIL